MRELLERGEFKVEFIPTAQNVSDIGTKILAEKLFSKRESRVVLDGPMSGGECQDVRGRRR
jgi:hypothetical protein